MEYEPFDQRVRRLVVHSIGRGCFFAALAIWCVMIGLISQPSQALRAGAILSLLVSCTLLLKGQTARERPFKRTEVWILLDRKLEVSPDIAQRLIGNALRETYLRYAAYAGLFAAGFLLLALLVFTR